MAGSLVKRYAGFSLVEVMISALIIVTSVSALVKLQSITFTSFAHTESRQSAVTLAQEKLDDLRHFDTLHPYQNHLAYTSIQTNKGGRIPSGNHILTFNPRQKIQQEYTLNWRVQDEYFVDSDNDQIKDLWVDQSHRLAPPILPIVAHRKQISVNVSWQQDSKKQTFTLSGLVSPTPLNRLHVLEQEENYDLSKPIVVSSIRPDSGLVTLHNSSTTNHRVVQTPSIIKLGNAGLNTVIEKVDLETQQVSSRYEYRTLTCSCRFEGMGQGKSPAIHRVVSNERLSIEKGQWLSKEIASALPNQDALCDTCCRDHHGSQTMSQQRRTYVSRDNLPHKHYVKTTNTRPVLVSNIGDKYQEMCRFIRVDGNYELTSDWHAADMFVISHNHINEPQTSRYRSRVKQGILSTLEATASSVNEVLRLIEGTNIDLQLRNMTLYVDPLLPDDIDIVSDKLNSKDENWVNLIPFYIIDTSIQTEWKSEFPAKVAVSNEAPADAFEPNKQRFLRANKGRVVGIESGTSAILTALDRGNAGILGLAPITPEFEHNMLLRSQPKINNTKLTAKRTLSGFIHCVDARTHIKSQCTNITGLDAHSLINNITIRLNGIDSPCELIAPHSGSTPYFVCQSVHADWQGEVMADTSKIPASIETYWLLPNNERLDGNFVPTELLVEGNQQHPLRLIVNVND